ncbi:hypothetical protein pb186bvf_018289 [Paramecium bursaria]
MNYDIQDNEIESLLNFDETQFRDVIKQLELIIFVESQLVTHYSGLTRTITKMQGDTSQGKKMQAQMPIMDEMFCIINETFENLMTKKKESALFMEKNIFPCLADQILDVKDIKMNLKEYQDILEKEKKKEYALSVSHDEGKSRELYFQLEKSRLERQDRGDKFKLKYTTYVLTKNVEVKAFYQHLLNQYLRFFAQGVNDCQMVNVFMKKMNDRRDIEKFLQLLLGSTL